MLFLIAFLGEFALEDFRTSYRCCFDEALLEELQNEEAFSPTRQGVTPGPRNVHIYVYELCISFSKSIFHDFPAFFAIRNHSIAVGRTTSDRDCGSPLPKWTWHIGADEFGADFTFRMKS